MKKMKNAAMSAALGVTLLTAACGSSTETFTKTVAAIDGTYLAAVQISQGAIASGLLSEAQKKAIFAADNLAFAEIVPLTQAAANSQPVTPDKIAAAQSAVASFKALVMQANTDAVARRIAQTRPAAPSTPSNDAGPQ